MKDPRHRDVALLHYEEISERRFGGWSMGQVNLSKLNHSILLKYSEKPELDPYAVSGKVSLALLEDLMATAAICGRVSERHPNCAEDARSQRRKRISR